MKINYKREDFPEPGDQYVQKGIQKLNTRDYSQALKCFEKASTYDNEHGLIFVAIFHLLKLGTSKRDPEKALIYFKKAALLWLSPVAQYLIGMIYFEGDEGIVQNYEEAFKWLLIAAKNGWSDAMGHLANAYSIGDIVKKDLSKAIYWLKQIEKKDDNANECIENNTVCLFGNCVFEVDMNFVEEEMKKLVKEASTRRLASFPIHASIQISLRYTDSEVDMIDQAFWWDTMSNTKSSSVAASQFSLAKIYELSILNKEKALYYYERAAKNGNMNVCLKIGLLYNKGVK